MFSREDIHLENAASQEKDMIERAVALARVEKPSYAQLYDFLEPLFLLRAEVKEEIRLDPPPVAAPGTRWAEGFPLLNRWDFPIDIRAAERILSMTGQVLPPDNRNLVDACDLLKRAFAAHADEAERMWSSFLHHEMEPWEEWFDAGSVELASVLFLARNAIRPSLEKVAEELLKKDPVPESWLKGFCPVCGSLPSLLYLVGDGQRKAFCSWCGTHWDLHRLQCPYCDNRYHDSLGYLAIETEPFNRITCCNLCKFYFKQLDTRDMAYPPYLPLEEWTTLHLDFLAQNKGWKQPPSPSPAVYGPAS